MKTYAPKTKSLAADVAIQEAVERAAHLLTNAAVIERFGAMNDRLRTEVADRAEQILRAAGETAELLLTERAS